jgi:Tfp pilus assembly protein PilV
MRPHRQRGTSLVEALVAFLVLTLGMLGVARMHTHVQRHADLARQTFEALRLAQEAMEGLRVPAGNAQPKQNELDQLKDAGSGSSGPTVYRLEREVDRAEGDRYSSARIRVSWADRTGETRRVELHSTMAEIPPALSGALAVQGRRERFASVQGRAPSVPLGAHPLGDGRSVLKPAGATVAFVFEDSTGRLAAQCTGLNAAPSSEQVTAQMLGACQAVQARLLSGWVRFAADATASMPMSIAVDLVGEAGSALCLTEARADTVAYHCAIATAGPWSGRSRIVPQGWALGNEPGQYRICRYSIDTDGSEAIDRPAEHPEHYSEVVQPLMQQNFLVIPGARSCADVDSATAAHQP